MPPDREAREFAELFSAVYVRFHRRVRPSVWRPSGESLALLRHLARIGPLTVTEASRHFERSQAAVSELLARLERRGLVERHADERDRRRTLVWLSDGGREALEKAERVLSERLVAHAFEQMEPDARAGLVAALRALLDTETATEGWDE